MEQKINEEKNPNNRVLCIDRRKTFAIKSIQRSVVFFLSHWPKNKVVYFLIQVFYFLFRLICITVAKKAVFVNNFARKSELR